MHELSYCEAVLAAVERRAAGRTVAGIGVRIGAVHRIVPAAFEQSFHIAAVGGPAADAVTAVTVVPVQAHCLACRTDFASADAAPACIRCGALEVAAAGGDEVVLEWLEYADSSEDDAGELVPAHAHQNGC